MATQQKPASKKADAPKKRRTTAAERRAHEAEELRKAQAAFEVTRPALWSGYWVRALEMALRGANDDEFRRQALDEFELDLDAKSLRIGRFEPAYTEATLSMAGHTDLDWRLTSIESTYKTLIEDREEQRRQADLRAQLRASGRSKLSDEEADALGIRI